MFAGIETSTLNTELKAIFFGMVRIVGRATVMKGGFRYSTRNSLVKPISEAVNVQVRSYVGNTVSLTTKLLGFEPAIIMLLRMHRKYHEWIRISVRDYPLGVKVTEEWYNRGISVVGRPTLLMR